MDPFYKTDDTFNDHQLYKSSIFFIFFKCMYIYNTYFNYSTFASNYKKN